MEFEYYKYNIETGIVVPNTADLKAEVEAEIKGIFGEDISTDPSTPEGRFIAYETECRSKVLQNNAAIANIFNPISTFGIFKEVLGAYFNLFKVGSRQTLVNGVTLTGVENTVIPAGSIAQTENGDNFLLQNQITIGTDGSATSAFVSEQYGAIPCDAGQLTKIITPILGWETVNNPSAGILGTESESDSEFDITNKYQGKALFASILAKAKKVDNTISINGFENYEKFDQIVDGITISANSIYVVAKGGADNDIAQAIFQSKSDGCGYTGDVLVYVIEEVTGVSYPVRFNRPVSVYAKASINVSVSSGSPTAADIQNSVTNFINSYDISQTLTIFDIQNMLVAAYPNITITDLKIANKSGTLGYAALTYKINECAAVQALADIVVTIA